MTANSAIVPPAAVAVIGLGNMGVPMGLRLIKAGFTVTGYDVSETARQNFAAAGGRIADHVAAAVTSADVVVTLLPNGKIVREAVNALREHLKPSAIVVDMSSSDPIGTGALGSGHAMKALNNYVSSAGLIATVEALLIGRKFGLDPALMADILNASSGKNNTTERKLKQFIISETFADGFPLRLMAKDVRTADDMAHALGIATPMADLCAQLWAAAAQSLSDKANHTEVLRYMEGLGG